MIEVTVEPSELRFKGFDETKPVWYKKLGIPNPFDAAIDTIEELRANLSEYSLSNENIPNFKNPFKNLPTPDLGPAAQGNIPTNVQNSAGFVGQSNITLPYNQLTQEQKLDRINELFNNG